MGLFNNQLCDVIEWKEFREDQIFYKWRNSEIKKDSKLIIRPGQDAIFLRDGKIEGIFTDEGNYDIETQIIPFLSSLKGFQFGFNSGMRAEILFINTREFQIKWGTKSPVQIQAQGLPCGMPIRANGTASFRVKDYVTFIDKVAGIKDTYVVEDVKEYIMSVINQLLMKWISQEGKDMFNLQTNSFEISKGILFDLNYELDRLGIYVSQFNVVSFNYPEQIQRMAEKAASQYMVGDLDKYGKMAMFDSLEKGNQSANQMVSMMSGMAMGKELVEQMKEKPSKKNSDTTLLEYPKFCPNCGNPTNGENFCANCGKKLK